jgi:hypothetical protein
MARKSRKRVSEVESKIVHFDFQQRTYEIDPQRRKVYRRFVEIETSKANEIFTVWKASTLQA